MHHMTFERLSFSRGAVSEGEEFIYYNSLRLFMQMRSSYYAKRSIKDLLKSFNIQQYVYILLNNI